MVNQFNPNQSRVLYLDINSCFATIEQQLNPDYRHKPLVVAAYTTSNGCVLAASIEAKRLGVRTGMKVGEAQKIFPQIIVSESHPDRYRFIHQKLKTLLSVYTDSLFPLSIDEFCLDFSQHLFPPDLFKLSLEIKERIKREVGDYLTVSIGLGPNRFLAKTASNLKKPDGLEEINITNYLEIYSKLSLTDLTGISTQNSSRLNSVGVYTVTDFFNAELTVLQKAFHSVVSRDWYLRLRGWEVDNVRHNTKSFGHSYSLPKFLKKEGIGDILAKLVEKTAFRLRQAGYQARGVSLGLVTTSRHHWHQSLTLGHYVASSQDIYQAISQLLSHSPYQETIRYLSVSCFDLSPLTHLQLDLFGCEEKCDGLNQALYKLKLKWGNFVVTPASMADTSHLIPDSIGFNRTP